MEAPKTFDWQADWIWTQGEAAPYHFFLLARRSFRLDAAPASAVLCITATDRYKLFVNGQYLGRGPARCDYRWQSYDTYDLTSLLQSGLNVIAVQGYHYGCTTGFTRDGRAGLLAQVEIRDRDGQTETIGTDASWRVRPAQGWRRDAKMLNSAVGVTEVYDARLDPPDWIVPEFDDGAWEAAQIITSRIWSRPLPRDIPMLSEEELFPARILGLGEALELDGKVIAAVDIPEVLAQEIHEPLRHARVENAAALLSGDESTAVVSTSRGAGADIGAGFRDPFILIDLGRQVNGFPRIRLDGQAGGIVDFTYGEELIGGRIPPIVMDVRLGDRYIMRDGPQTWETSEYKSFRYLQVSFRNLAEPVRVRSISVNTYRYPAAIRGRFDCSDAMLSKLWQACANTTDLCMDDGFMDSPVREKRNWLGDGSHALLGVYAAFGDIALIRRYFRLVVQGALGDGMLRMFHPSSDYPIAGTKVTSTIPQHALVWAMRVWEHFEYFGDHSLLEELYPTLAGLAGWCVRHANHRGLLEDLPYWNWLDWTPIDMRGANLGTNAFYLKLLQDLSVIAQELGQSQAARQWAEDAGKLRASLRELFWDDDRGLYQDSLYQGALTGIASELANGLALLFGIADAAQAGRIAAHLADDSDLAPVTPLFHHYVFQGLARAGRPDLALALARRRYGLMLEKSDTIWENFYHSVIRAPVERKVPDIHSVLSCTMPETARYRPANPWLGLSPTVAARTHCAGVPVAFLLLTEILGIRPQGPGFKRCLLQPRTDLLEQASGVFPSIRGDIHIAWQRADGRLVLTVGLPEGLEADLQPAKDGEQYGVVRVDGKQIAGGLSAIPLPSGNHRVEMA